MSERVSGPTPGAKLIPLMRDYRVRRTLMFVESACPDPASPVGAECLPCKAMTNEQCDVRAAQPVQPARMVMELMSEHSAPTERELRNDAHCYKHRGPTDPSVSQRL